MKHFILLFLTSASLLGQTVINNLAVKTNFFLQNPAGVGQVLTLENAGTGKVGFKATEVTNVASLKALSTNAVLNGSIVATLGYYSEGDGGNGAYRYDSGSAAAADDGLVIAPTHGVGRYLLIHDRSASLRQFGARGDGSSNDTTPLQNAVSALNAGSIEKLRVPAGRFVLRDDFILTGSNIVIEGDGPDSVFGSAQTDGVNNVLFDIQGTNIVFDKITTTRLSNTNLAQGVANTLYDIKATARNFTYQNGIVDGGMTNQVTGRTGYYFREFRASGWTSTNYYPSGIFIQDNFFTDTGSRAIDLRGVENVKITGNFGTFCGINIPPYAPSTNKPLGTFIEVQSYDTGGQVNWSTNVVIANNLGAFWGDGFINTGGTSDMAIIDNAGISAYAMGLDRDTYLPSTALGENGISLFGGRRTTITGNTVAYVGQQAFQIRTEEASLTYFKDLQDIVVANNVAVSGVDQRGDLLESNYAIYGINTNTSARNITFTGNVHRSYADTGGALALQMAAGGSLIGVNITGNSFYGSNNTNTSYRAISYSGSGSGTASGISIVANLIGNYHTGLYSAGTWPSDTVSAHNRFYDVNTQNNLARTFAFDSGDGFISIKGSASGNSAASGHIRLPNAAAVRFRNAADSGDVVAMTVNSSNEIEIGTYLQVVPANNRIQIASSGKLIIGSATQTPAAGGQITPSGTAVRTSGSGGAVTLGATAITNGDSTGQMLLLIGTSDANTVTINDASNTNLGAASRTLGLNDTLLLVYVSGQGWNEIAFSNN